MASFAKKYTQLVFVGSCIHWWTFEPKLILSWTHGVYIKVQLFIVITFLKKSSFEWVNYCCFVHVLCCFWMRFAFPWTVRLSHNLIGFLYISGTSTAGLKLNQKETFWWWKRLLLESSSPFSPTKWHWNWKSYNLKATAWKTNRTPPMMLWKWIFPFNYGSFGVLSVSTLVLGSYRTWSKQSYSI